MEYINLIYLRSKVKDSKFELLKTDTNYSKIYLNMCNIEKIIIKYLNKKFMDINVNYIYDIVVKIKSLDNFYKILKLLNDLFNHLTKVK